MKKQLVVSMICTGVMAVTFVAGCKTDGACSSASSEMEESMMYVEKMHDGRYYVVGTEAGLESVEQGGHLPYTKTMIGAGPKGETVVVEVDKDNPDMAESLWAKFKSKHNL